MKKFLFVLFVIVSFTSCEQFASRKFGGDITINLEPGEKLVEATWKESNLWYLVEPMDSNYEPKIKVFKENSLCGVLEGTVTFVEHK